MDGYFFGRDDLVHDIIGESELGLSNHGVFGLRKTGKTSILYALMRRLESRPILTPYFELGMTGNIQMRWWAFLEYVVAKCAEQLGIDELPGRGRYEPGQAGISFRDDIATILARDDVEQIVLLFDEIERMTPGLVKPWGVHWNDDFEPFWSSIRGVHQTHLGKIRFVVAGVNPRCISSSSFGRWSNPIFQGATQHLLSPFSRATVEEMSGTIGRTAGVVFTGGAYDLLLDTCAGHPYLTRMACSVVARSVDDTAVDILQIDRNEFAKHIEQIDAILTDPIRDILNSFLWWFRPPSLDFELLKAWAEQDEELIASHEKKHPVEVDRFRQWGMVRGNRMAIHRMAEFLRDEAEKYREELDTATMSDVSVDEIAELKDLSTFSHLNRLRTAVEIKLRCLVYDTLRGRAQYDDKRLARDISRGMPTIKNRNNADLFIGITPEAGMRYLYMSDLGPIIVRYWDAFRQFFRVGKDSFLEHCDVAVVGRNREAHVHLMPSEDVSAYILNYNWLLGLLKSVPKLPAFDPDSFGKSTK